MAEKESKHIADQYIVNCQHSGIFTVSPNTCMYYTERKCEVLKLPPVETKTLSLFSIVLLTATSYLVALTYAVVQFHIYMNENFLRA